MQESTRRLSAPEPGLGMRSITRAPNSRRSPSDWLDPDVPCTVVGEGKDDAVRYCCYRNKSVGLEKGNPAWRPDPQLPASVLKEGVRLVRQPAICNLSNPCSSSRPFLRRVR